MKCNVSSVLVGTPKLLTALALSALLVACGGGTSGDTDAGTADGGGLDAGDLDLTDAGADDLGTTDLDLTDPDLTDPDLNITPDDDDGNGISNADELLVWKGRGGSDPGSTNAAWNDNCTIEYDIQRDIEGVTKSPFYYTTYVQGIQRIVFCQEHAGVADSVDAFADGFYGVKSYNAVIEFQKAHGLIADGIVGPLTWGKLQEQVEDPALLTADSDADYNAYGIAQNTSEDATGAIDCRADTNFFGKFSTDLTSEDAFEAWEMSKSSGSAEKGSFSIAAPSN